MLVKIIITAVTFYVLVCDVVFSAPTLLMEPSRSVLEEQRLGAQKDLEQFFKDQAHLVAGKQNITTNNSNSTNGDSIPVQIGNILIQLPGQVGPINDFISILSNLGLPFMLDPTALGQAIGGATNEAVAQLLESLKDFLIN